MVPVAAKAGALLAVAAAGSTSIWYFSDSIFGASLVSVADEQESGYGDNSLGKKYGKYFLSSKKNQKIWEERYEKKKSKFSTGGENDKVKDKFVTVAKGYSDTENDTTALNKVCEAVYKEITSGNLVDTDTADKYTTEHIWKFCGLRDIVTLDKDKGNYPDSNFGTDKVGGDATNKKLFVSTKAKDNVNDWFWKLKTDEFWSGTPSVQGTSTTDNVFKKLKDDTSKKGTNIKDTCEEAYAKTSSDDSSKKNKEDALTFCSIKLEFSSAS